MMKLELYLFGLVVMLVSACNSTYDQETFGSDLEILQDVEDVTVLREGNSMIAVSGAYQGRIFTSTTDGINGRSLAYFNREAIKNGDSNSKLCKLGGAGRMWFGPEVGKYAIFFAPNTEQNANTIEVSPELNTNKFHAISKTNHSITYGNKMEIRNANSYIFNFDAKRKISLITQKQIESELSIKFNQHLKHVGYSSETWLTNTGVEQWTKENGLLSIWDIGCMLPNKSTVVMIPCKAPLDSVNIYFTSLTGKRIRMKDSVIYYKADAQYMNKIGVQPHNCKNVFGSYSPELNLLTIVKYNFDNDSLYVNSFWGHKDPYKGDVINVFNGEINDSLQRNWPFYELETSSSAKELNVGESMYHKQSIYHFEGSREYLEIIAEDILGVSLQETQTIFQ